MDYLGIPEGNERPRAEQHQGDSKGSGEGRRIFFQGTTVDTGGDEEGCGEVSTGVTPVDVLPCPVWPGLIQDGRL